MRVCVCVRACGENRKMATRQEMFLTEEEKKRGAFEGIYSQM
jgi:hypothetical protein